METFEDIAGDDEDAKELSDDDVMAYIKWFEERSSAAKIDPNVIEKAVEVFALPMNLRNDDARIKD